MRWLALELQLSRFDEMAALCKTINTLFSQPLRRFSHDTGVEFQIFPSRPDETMVS